MRRITKLLATVLSMTLLATVPTGCSGPAKSTNMTPQQTAPESTRQEDPAQSDQQPETEEPRLAGKVVETMDGGGYTYICLEKNGKKIWAAVPAMKVTAGEDIELQPGMKMVNFTSKALNKTFKVIIFSEGPVPKK